MAYCIGVDLGGTNIAAGVVDLHTKKIIKKMSVKTNAPRSCEAISADIKKLCVDVCESASISLCDVEWIGVATPGIVKDGVVVVANNLGWNNAKFSDILGGMLGTRVFVANDANAAAFAEAIWGVGVGAGSLVAITLGTGVGGGIVIDGKIWEGHNGFAAEMGHMIVEADGRECSCGKAGCLERYCSASSIVSDAREAMKKSKTSLLYKMCDGDPARVNGVIPFRAAERGDKCAQGVIDNFIKYLAIGISNVINMFQPDVLCVGGGISGEGEKLLVPLRAAVERITFGTNGNRTRIETAKFMNDAGILGAALLGMQEEQIKMKNMTRAIIEAFAVEGEITVAQNYGNGHINDTKYIVIDNGVKKTEYILQKINKNVFKKPDELMDNYVAVTEFLRKIIIENGGDPDRETLNAIKAKDGKNFVIDENGDYWRLILFVKDSMSFDLVERPEQFYDSAVAFGNFQYLLRNYPADTLHETIVNFHNTPDRYRQLMDAIERDTVGRAASVKDEIEFAKAHKDFTEILENAHKEGRLPLKVTHNDTKLNNILFDRASGKPLCIIDLDTIMPGYSVNDFGDSIRFGATTALEDETDLSKVNFDIELYELYVKGFIEGAKGGLTEGELELLPIGAIMMTLECGMRFLADHLNGDTYFRISRENHNLDRARNQFKLVSDMEARLDEMKAIVKKYS